MGENPRRGDWRGVVADIERAATAAGRASMRRFSLEGTRLHERALRAEVPIDRVVATEGFLRSSDDRIRSLFAELEASGCEIHLIPEEVLARLTDGRSIGAVIGLAPVPEEPSLEVIFEPRIGARQFVLVGVEIGDPGNLGALVRTALASGASGFLSVGPGDPFHPRAVRTSMGSIFKLPVRRFDTADGALAALEAKGAWKIGAVSAGGSSPSELDPGGGDVLAVFMGSEAFGLPPCLLEALDARVTIPMADGVDSYSVNAAAAILLHEVARRSRSGPQ